jgi:Rieske Fe-S protein
MSDGPRVISLDELKRGLTRRAFCQAACVAAGAAALPACFGDGQGRIGVGPLDDLDAGTVETPPDFAGPRPDFAGHPPPQRDMTQSQPEPDMAKQTGACVNAGFSTKKPPASFALNTATYFSSQSVFVCRDANGLYAVSSICPHAGCDVTFRLASVSFRCPCHGATFNFNGGAPTAPAFQPLDHYLLCIEGDGSVGFDINSPVTSTTRLNV